MTIHDIENKSFAELKAERAELIEAAKALPHDDVAARYIQARTDAKQRDGRLAEQGQTIAALRDGLEASKGQAEATEAQTVQLTSELGAVRVELGQSRTAANAKEVAFNGQVKGLAEQLQRETARANRLKAEALRGHVAVSSAAKLLNDTLAVKAVEDADTGE